MAANGTEPVQAGLHEVGDYVAWVLMGAFGLLGLIMASGAHDDEIYVFGLSLAGFAVLFLTGEMVRHCNAADAAHAAAREAAHV